MCKNKDHSLDPTSGTVEKNARKIISWVMDIFSVSTDGRSNTTDKFFFRLWYHMLIQIVNKCSSLCKVCTFIVLVYYCKCDLRYIGVSSLTVPTVYNAVPVYSVPLLLKPPNYTFCLGDVDRSDTYVMGSKLMENL